MPKTARTVRRVLAPIFLVVAMSAVAGQVVVAATAGAGSAQEAARAVHIDGMPCITCGG